jgi:hypothetical protein
MLLTASCVGALIAGRCPEFVSGHVDLVLSLVVFAMHWDWGAVPFNSKIKSQQVHMTISSPVSIVSLTRQFHTFATDIFSHFHCSRREFALFSSYFSLREAKRKYVVLPGCSQTDDVCIALNHVS